MNFLGWLYLIISSSSRLALMGAIYNANISVLVLLSSFISCFRMFVTSIATEYRESMLTRGVYGDIRTGCVVYILTYYYLTHL